MIARGLVSVLDEQKFSSVELKQLYAGDFFGEAALLHGTARNATVLAITPCSLYELHRDEWLQICRQHPNIETAVEAIDRERKLETRQV